MTPVNCEHSGLPAACRPLAGPYSTWLCRGLVPTRFPPHRWPHRPRGTAAARRRGALCAQTGACEQLRRFHNLEGTRRAQRARRRLLQRRQSFSSKCRPAFAKWLLRWHPPRRAQLIPPGPQLCPRRRMVFCCPSLGCAAGAGAKPLCRRASRTGSSEQRKRRCVGVTAARAALRFWSAAIALVAFATETECARRACVAFRGAG